MTETESKEEERPEPIVKTVTLKGRKVRIHTPKPEQVMIWQRVMNRLSNMGNDVTGEQALNALDRARKIIDSVLVDEADIEWLDDQMLDGSLGFKEMADFMLRAAKTLSKESEKQATSSTARRKKPSQSKKGGS